MKKLDEWAKGKPIVLAIFAQQVAFSAELCFEFFELFKVGKRIENYHELPPIKIWLGFYRNHPLLYEYLIKTFKEFGGIAEVGAELAELLSFN